MVLHQSRPLSLFLTPLLLPCFLLWSLDRSLFLSSPPSLRGDRVGDTGRALPLAVLRLRGNSSSLLSVFLSPRSPGSGSPCLLTSELPRPSGVGADNLVPMVVNPKGSSTGLGALRSLPKGKSPARGSSSSLSSYSSLTSSFRDSGASSLVSSLCSFSFSLLDFSLVRRLLFRSLLFSSRRPSLWERSFFSLTFFSTLGVSLLSGGPSRAGPLSRLGGTGVVPGVPPRASPSGGLRKELRTSARSLKTPAHSRKALSAGASSKGPSCWVHRKFSRLSVRQPAHQSRAGLGQPLQLMSFKPTLTGHTGNWLFNPGVGVSYTNILLYYIYIYPTNMTQNPLPPKNGLE